MHQRHALLEHAIDYAGLFPPASRSLADAIARFAGHARSEDAWALGRFVAPAGRLAELVELLPQSIERWPLAVTVSEAWDADLSAVADAEGHPSVRVEAVEGRAGDAGGAVALLHAVPDRFARFAEIPLNPDPDPAIAAIARAGGGVKFRTGGVVADAFPDPDPLLRGISAAIRHGAPFKCTAGLHHPVRGRYRLTYEPGSPLAVMYGYLNVLSAAAALLAGWPEEEARDILLEENPTAFTLSGQGVGWRNRWIQAGTVAALRHELLWGIGACSFREPMDELAEIPVG